MDFILLILFAFVPTVLFGIYIYSKDKHKEPVNLLVKLFVTGLICAGLSKILELCFIGLFKYEYLYNFLCIGIVCELLKFVATYFFGYLSSEFDESFDIVLYAIFVALGFSFTDNVMNIVNVELNENLIRCIILIPLHVCYGTIMGEYLLKYRRKGKKKDLIMSFLVPGIIHGSFEVIMLFDNIPCMVAFYVIVLLLLFLCSRNIKYDARYNRKLSNKE